MQRFYIPSPDISDNVIQIKDHRILHQMNKVLRMKTGDRFTVFNEDGQEFMVAVLKINNRKTIGNVIEEIKNNTESELDVHIYQAIPKKTALFELVVQKATEIGATHIYPLITNRTEKHRISKFQRLLTIATEATEQSRRTKVPTIHHPVNFEEVIERVENAYIAYEYEDKNPLFSYLNQIKKEKSVHIFIGPEGGFEQSEIDFAILKKAKLFTLGPRILRTETASIAALSMILLED